MATTIPVSDDTKKLYDEHKTDDFKNWDVFMQHVIEVYESGGGKASETEAPDIDTDELINEIRETLGDELDVTVDTSPDIDADELAESLKKTLASDLEVSAYRGSKEAIEEATR